MRTSSLTYSSYLGGSGDDRATAVWMDNFGRTCVTGSTSSGNFPIRNALQETLAGGTDAFVMCLAGSSNSLLYSTFLGGKADEIGRSITSSALGEVYVGGETTSGDFPVNAGLQSTKGGGTDAFVAKLNSNGTSIVFSTYLGGDADNRANAVAVDPDSNIWVAGVTVSRNFPLSKASQSSFYGGGASDGFLIHLKADGSDIDYGTYIGGSGDDQVLALNVPSFGDAYIVGSTSSQTWPSRTRCRRNLAADQRMLWLHVLRLTERFCS